MKYLRFIFCTSFLFVLSNAALSAMITGVDSPANDFNTQKYSDAKNLLTPDEFNLESWVANNSTSAIGGLDKPNIHTQFMDQRVERLLQLKRTHVAEPGIFILFVIGLLGLVISRRQMKS